MFYFTCAYSSFECLFVCMYSSDCINIAISSVKVAATAIAITSTTTLAATITNS